MKIIRSFNRFASVRPSLYFTLAARNPVVRKNRVRRGTEIVIEAPPRSANSFTYKLFCLCQNRGVIGAHHLHRASQYVYAARLDIPVLLIVRNPFDASVSKALYSEDVIHAGEFLKDYSMFFEPLLSGKCPKAVVVRFEDSLSRFDELVEIVNRRYAVSFKHTNGDSEIIEEAANQMRLYNLRKKSGKVSVLPLPSEEKEASKIAIESQVKRRFRDELRKAENIYEKLLSDFVVDLG